MTSEIEAIVKIRSYKPEDRNLILSTFLKGLYYGNKFYNMIPKDAFMANYKAVAEALITNGHIRVACLKEDEDVIVGYAVTGISDTTLHWVHVKSGPDKELTWRKRGIMKMLVPTSISNYTHFTTLWLVIKDKLYPNATFNPFKQ